MKQLGKKFLATILALAMVVSLLPQSMVYATESSGTEQEYQIYPTPHEVTYQEGDFIIRADVNVVFESEIDDATKDRMNEVLATKNKNVTVSDAKVDGKTNILVGVYGSDEYVDTYAAEKYEIDETLFDYYASHYVISSNDEIIILGLDTDAAFYGVTSLKHIFNQMEGSTIRNFTIKDYADVNIRGFIEGYYGLPWSNENRMSLMEFGGEFKMTSYIFAPKDDVYHTSKWRDLYPAEEITKIEEMVEVGNKSKCRFVWTAHPFMGGFNSNDVDGEIAALLNKFDQLYDAGVRQFGVLGDDVGSLNKDIVIQLMNAVSEWANEKGDVYDTVFCPAGYNHSWQGNYSELNTYDAGFPDDVQIFWTGEAVCQPVEQKTLEHFRNHNYTATGEKAERRAPLFWLNWPVNDINHSRMLMGKGSLLHTDINVDDLAGIVTNPMQEGQPSKVAIFAVADYSWNVADFDDDQSWVDSFAYIDENAAEELYTLAKHMSNPEPNGHGLVLAESEELQPLISEFKNKLADGSSLLETGAQLVAEMDVIINACRDFHTNSKNAIMKEELLPFTNSLSDLVTAIKNYTLAAMALEEGNGTAAFGYYSVASEAHADSESYIKKVKGGSGFEIVDPGSTYLMPLATTIQETIADEVTAYALGEGYEQPLVLTASSNITNWYEGPVGNIIDGNPSTSAWQNGYEAVGQYYQVNFSEASDVYGVEILNGCASKADDTFKRAKLQYTTDGTTWVDVPNGATTEDYQTTLSLSGLQLKNVVGLRYICTVAGTKWPSMREFTVNTTPVEVEFTSEVIRTTEGWSFYENSDASLIDGNKNSYVWYRVRQGDATNPNTSIPGDYVGVKLSQPITLGKINVLQGKDDGDGDYFSNATLQYSVDGTTWTDIETFNSVHNISVDLSAQDITAQYVRLRNNANTGWVSFREFTVAAKPVAEGLVYTNVDAYAEVTTSAEVDTYTLDALNDVTLENGQYLGLKLDRIHELAAVNVAASSSALTLQVSENSVEWKTVTSGTVNENARYIRLINNTDAAVTFNITNFVVSTVEVEEKSIEATNYSAFEGDFSLLFDGDWTTASQFKASQNAGMYITIDLGSEIALNSFKAVCRDSEHDYIRHGKFSVSTDNSTWTEILTLGNQDGPNEGEADNADEIGHALPDHEISYNTKSVSGLNLTARYLKFEVTRTKVGADKWVRFQEFEINGGAYVPVVNDPTVEVAVENHGNFFSALTDNSLSTAYTLEGTLIYHESEEDAFNSVKVIQNGISNAELFVRFANEEDYTFVGTLSQTINEYVAAKEIVDVKILTVSNLPAIIAEIMFSEKDVTSVDKTQLAALLDARESIGTWTTDSAQAYETTYAAANEINNKDYATQATVDAIVQQLQNAIASRELKGNADAVEIEINTEILDEASYTTATWKAYAKAVNAAVLALEDANNMSVAEAAAFIAAMQEARENLRYNPTKYEEASLYIDECEDVDGSLYTEESYAAYVAALTELETMVANGSQSHTPAEFAAAKAEVEAKYEALVPMAGEEPTPDPTPTPTPDPENPEHTDGNVCVDFEDVAHGSWYEEAVQYVFDNGIMTGIGGTSNFEPESQVIRAVVIETLYKLEGSPKVDALKVPTLKDFDANDWWSDALTWAFANGIATGNTHTNTFDGMKVVTREEVATFLYRYAKYKANAEIEVDDTILGDTEVSDWAKDGFAWVVENGIITGIETETGLELAPEAGAIRAQLATIMMRYCD